MGFWWHRWGIQCFAYNLILLKNLFAKKKTHEKTLSHFCLCFIFSNPFAEVATMVAVIIAQLYITEIWMHPVNRMISYKHVHSLLLFFITSNNNRTMTTPPTNHPQQNQCHKGGAAFPCPGIFKSVRATHIEHSIHHRFSVKIGNKIDIINSVRLIRNEALLVTSF